MYLIAFIAIGAFIFANLVVAVVVTNLECAVLDVRKEEQEIAKEQESKGLVEKEDTANASIISDENIPSNVFKNQEPLFLPVRIQIEIKICLIRFIMSVLGGIVLYCIVLYCTVLYCIALYRIVLYYIVFQCIVLYYIVFQCIVLYCIAFQCIVMYHIAMYSIVLYFVDS